MPVRDYDSMLRNLGHDIAFGVCHVSTGDMLRAEIKLGTPIGKQAQHTILQGMLLPDRLMVRLVRKRLNRDKRCQANGWLLDGFPRTAGQALTMLSAGLIPHHILVLNASRATLLSRALGRAELATRNGATPRKDDNAETLRTRLVEDERNRAATLRVRVVACAGAISTICSLPLVREAWFLRLRPQC